MVLVRDTAWSRKLIEFILRLTYEDYEGNLKEAAAACTHANCNTFVAVWARVLLKAVGLIAV